MNAQPNHSELLQAFLNFKPGRRGSSKCPQSPLTSIGSNSRQTPSKKSLHKVMDLYTEIIHQNQHQTPLSIKPQTQQLPPQKLQAVKEPDNLFIRSGSRLVHRRRMNLAIAIATHP